MGMAAPVQILIDGSDSNTASIALGYANGIVQPLALEILIQGQNRVGSGASGAPINARLRVWYNSQLRSKNYIVPGLLSHPDDISAAHFSYRAGMEMGTMEQLLSTPLRPAEVALGK
jgi:ABC-2 type transport system permease protein